MKRETFSEFDAADYLKSEDDIAAYLQAATEDGDPQVLFAAMGDVVRARNVSQVAREAGLTREGIYKALSPEGNPSFATFWRVANALNIGLYFGTKAEAIEAARARAKSGDLAHAKVIVHKSSSRDRIDVDDPESVRYWTKALGVSSTKLKSAVKGSGAKTTRHAVLRKSSVGRRMAK
jgi:probable addiction module antidote protein